MIEPIRYRKLASGSFFFGRESAWLANDHLLIATMRGYSEYYKRFYFPDIQAIVLRKTREALVINILAGFCSLVFFGFAIAWFPDLRERNVAAFILLGISAFFLLILLINVLMGPTCELYLQTAVQRQKIRAVRRLRRARKFATEVVPLIQSSQIEAPAAPA